MVNSVVTPNKNTDGHDVPSQVVRNPQTVYAVTRGVRRSATPQSTHTMPQHSFGSGKAKREVNNTTIAPGNSLGPSIRTGSARLSNQTILPVPCGMARAITYQPHIGGIARCQRRI